MAELVDALDSGSSEEIRKSSTLFMSTTKKISRTNRLSINIQSEIGLIFCIKNDRK